MFCILDLHGFNHLKIDSTGNFEGRVNATPPPLFNKPVLEYLLGRIL